MGKTCPDARMKTSNFLPKLQTAGAVIGNKNVRNSLSQPIYFELMLKIKNKNNIQ